MRTRAAGGDADSAWLLDEWRAGRVLLVSVTITAAARDAAGAIVAAIAHPEPVWLEVEDLPLVERQVADVCPSELAALATDLGQQGLAFDASHFNEAFIHVELGERLRRTLGAR